jgi:hypothetical protein
MDVPAFSVSLTASLLILLFLFFFGFAPTPSISASAHLGASSFEILWIVVVLVEEAFQAVTDHFRAVVTKSVAEAIELSDEVGGGANA